MASVLNVRAMASTSKEGANTRSTMLAWICYAVLTPTGIQNVG